MSIGRQRSPEHASGDHMVRYLRAANVKDGRLELDDVLTMNFTPSDQSTYGLEPGDVLVTEGCGSIRELGASAPWRGEVAGTVCFQNTLLRLRARPGVVLPGFLALWASHAHHSGAFASVASGTNIFHIGLKRALGMSVDLPPVADQRRIVDLVATADEVVASAERTAAGARAMGNALRASWFGAQIARQRPLRESVEVTNGRLRNPGNATGPFMTRYVRAANVQDARIVMNEPMSMNFTPQEQEKYRLRSGDVLVTEGSGSRRSIGASARWSDEVEGVVCFQNHLLRLRTRDEAVARQDLVYQWALWSYRSGRFGEIATGTNILSLGAGNVASMGFPVVPPEDAIPFLESVVRVEGVESSARRVTDRLIDTRDALLAQLLSGAHQIPASYDRFLEPVA